MAIDTVAGLIDALRQHRLLEPAQLEETSGPLRARFTDVRALAKELLQRGWLTPYQVNQILKGHAADLLLGSYVLMERVGEGGMGQVFKARHQKLGRVVALKIIRKDRVSNQEALRRFHREIQAVAQLSHPNVVMAYDADQFGDLHFFAMEFVEGTDLGRWIKQHGPLPVRDSCQYIREAALGLQHAHERGLVHRDIKPSNLLVTNEALKSGGQSATACVKLMDLGLVALRGTGDDTGNTLTQEGTVVGTPDFIAPEQARNASKADIRADLYSLGCTFFFLLAGQPPYASGTMTEKLLKHHWDPIPNIEERRPDVPRPVGDIIRKLMAKKPEERFQKPAELAEALKQVLDPKAPAPLVRSAPVVVIPPPAPPSPPPAAPITAAPAPVPVAQPAALPATAITATPPSLAQRALERVKQFDHAAFLARMNDLRTRRRPLFFGGVGAIAFVFLMCGGCFLFSFRSSGTTDGRTQAKGTHAGGAPAHSDAVDGLRRDAIPAVELAAAGGGDPKQAPAGLVAVFGDSRLKHWGEVTCVAFHPLGETVASASLDGSARIWDASTGRLRRTLIAHPSGVVFVAFDADGKRLITVGGDQTARIWDPLTGRDVGNPIQLGSTPVAFAPQGILVAAGGMGGALPAWDINTGKRHRPYRGGFGRASCLAFSSDGKNLAAGGGDGSLRVWDGGKEDDPRRLTGHRDGITALAFSPDGKYLASASRDGVVKFWDVAGERELGTINNEQQPVFGLAYSPDGKSVVGTAGGPMLRVWDATSGQELRQLRGHFGMPTSVAFHPKKHVLVSGGRDWQVKLWDVEGGRELLPAPPPIIGLTVAFSPDGKYLAWGGRDNAGKLWDLANNRELRSLTGHPSNQVTAVAFTPNSKVLASAGFDGSLHLWDVAGAQNLPVLRGHGLNVPALAFSTDGKTLASGSWDRTVRLADITTGSPFSPLPRASEAMIYSLAYSPDGKLLAAGSADSIVHVWDLNTRSERLLRGHQRDVMAVAFGADSKTVASASADGTVKFWDANTGAEQRSWSSLGARPVQSLAFAPDGRSVAAAALNGAITLIDPKNGTERQSIAVGPPNGAILQLAFSPEGRHIATANGNGTVYVIRLPGGR